MSAKLAAAAAAAAVAAPMAPASPGRAESIEVSREEAGALFA
jgi:hypothetical protein